MHMPLELDIRKKPTDVKVRVSSGEGVDVVWSDAHASHYDFAYLRDQCPCAHCNDERQKKSSQAGASRASVLPMYKPKVTAKNATAVGNYAIQIEFSDGHASGIFSFGVLREICPCPECRREFGAIAVSAIT
jgi:DUF971 family protein